MAFAAEARARPGILTPHTELACRVLWGLSAAETAALTQEVGTDLPPDRDVPGNGVPGVPAFEVWRQRIQQRFVSGGMEVWTSDPASSGAMRRG
jgi:hypothetical protein